MASGSSTGRGRDRYLECEDCGFLADESQIDERPADGRAAAPEERVCPVCHGRAFPVLIRHAA